MKPARKTPPGFVTITVTKRIRVSAVQGKLTRLTRLREANLTRIKELEEANVTLGVKAQELEALLIKIKKEGLVQ